MLYSSECWGTKCTYFHEEWRQHFKFLMPIEAFSCFLGRQLGAHTSLKRQLFWENLVPSSTTLRLLTPGDMGEFSHTMPDLQEIFPCSCYHLKDFWAWFGTGTYPSGQFLMLSTAWSSSLEVCGSGLTAHPYLHRSWHLRHPPEFIPSPRAHPYFLLIDNTIAWKMILTSCRVIYTE